MSKQILNFVPGDADESWPDMVIPAIKPTESVSRSITSLGRILESDEKLLISPDNNIKRTSQEILESEGIENMNYNEDQIVENKQITIPSASPTDVIIYNKTTKDSSPNIQTFRNYMKTKSKINTNLVIKDSKTADKTIPESNSHSLKSIDTKKNNKIHVKDKKTKLLEIKSKQSSSTEKGYQNLIVNKKNNIDGVQQKATKSKFDYKVNPKSAPSWITYLYNESTKTKDKIKVNEYYNRKWCKDLDKVASNLNVWSDWLDNTCKNMSILKVEDIRKKTPHAKKERDWMKLKRDINEDILLWTKFSQTTKEKLRDYEKNNNYKYKIATTEHYLKCDYKNKSRKTI